MPEPVTQSFVRVLDLPGGGGSFALVTLDNGLGRPATLGPAGLRELSHALDVATASGVAGIGITGVDNVFCAGAELSIMTSLTTRGEALEFAQLGHRVLRRLGEMPVPTFAFVNGVALGGGLEVALHCTYRTVNSNGASLGLPEVGLGIIPGWGGAWLLPNLVGIEPALRLIIESAIRGERPADGRQFADFDSRSVLRDPESFLDASLEWAGRVLRGVNIVGRQEIDRDERRWQAAINRTRSFVDARLHEATPAPYRALQLLSDARTATREDGFRAEDEALADLVMTGDSRAAIYALTLTRSRAKRPEGVPEAALPRRVRMVGVVGAGLMASQLAMLTARRLGVPVVITDLDQRRVDQGLAWIGGEVESLRSKGRLSAEEGERVTKLVSGTVDKAALGASDLVIEAVSENLNVKTSMLTELELLLRPDCVIATNTSSLSLAAMAAVLATPRRFVGMHFFNPVARMPLLEIISVSNTDGPTLATAFAVGRQLGKTCVLVRDAPGFVVNRLLTRMYAELMRAIDEGTPVAVAELALSPLGLPMSPFALLALIGPAVQLHVNETLALAWPDRFPVSPNLEAIAASGARTVLAEDDPAKLAPDIQAILNQGDQPSSADQVLSRVRDALADEVWRMLDEGVVPKPQDIDTCMLLGAGWPAHMGGITPWLDRSGNGSFANRGRFLAPGVASVGT